MYFCNLEVAGAWTTQGKMTLNVNSIHQEIEVHPFFLCSNYSKLEDQVAEAVKELQENTIEMERNRVVPELIGLYNAENEAHNLLPNTKCISKLIGTKNKRVITAFNPSESIEFIDTHLRIERTTKDLSKADHDAKQLSLEDPLYWDQNWTWDY